MPEREPESQLESKAQEVLVKVVSHLLKHTTAGNLWWEEITDPSDPRWGQYMNLDDGESEGPRYIRYLASLPQELGSVLVVEAFSIFQLSPANEERLPYYRLRADHALVLFAELVGAIKESLDGPGLNRADLRHLHDFEEKLRQTFD